MSRHPAGMSDGDWDEAADQFYANDLRTAARTILRGFDEGVFVRSTDNDHDPAWAIKLFPFIQALAVAQQAIAEHESVDAVDPHDR